ncbi:sporulation delaying protein family toxin [Streptomyces blastmyceticus]|uniref:Sporulation delaying protein family toxin n=1 Tax=Streptomyces blastmyceticus TaxID=68180 RepID=A0ABP3G504_9ACTN
MHRRVSVAIAAVAVLGLSGAAVQGAMASPVTSHPRAAVAAATSAEANRDGRALFEGLAFAQGSVAETLGASGKFVNVAALRKANSTPEQRQAASALLDKIQKNRPQFFGTFSAKLRSGDPRKVQSGIADAGEVLQSLSSKSSARSADTGAGVAQCATIVLALNVLVAVNLGGAINVSVAVNAQAAVNAANTVNFWSSPSNGGQSLDRDQQIAGLTKVLAA